MAKKKIAQDEPLEKQLWKAADKLRKNIDAAEYKHVMLPAAPMYNPSDG